MRIAFLGDLALVGRYDLRKNPSALQRLDALAAHLAEFDLVVGNLESPVTTRRRSHIPKSMHVWTSPESLEVLTYLGVDAVSLANNHINDFGRAGIEETLAALAGAEIQAFGVDGRTFSVDTDGEKVAFSGFACLSTNGTGYAAPGGRGVNTLTREALEHQLHLDQAIGAFSVLALHWGQEHTHLPNPEHIRLARSLAASKRFLIHGHHPHVLQGLENIGDCLVAYSLGNCLFDEIASLDGQKVLRQLPQNERSMVLDVDITGGRIVQFRTTGFEETADGIRFSDGPSDEIVEYSRMLALADEPEAYDQRRQDDVAATLTEKFGKRDMRWLLSRLDYHTVGSRLMAIPRRRRYRQVKERF